MGDHWKSLANKLGAPGMDAPMTEPAAEAPVRPAPAPPRAEKAAAPERSAPRPRDTPAAPAPAPVELVREPVAPKIEQVEKVEKPTKRKSSWDTLTSFFGIASSQEPDEPVIEVSSAAPAETDALGGAAAQAAPSSGHGARGRSRESRPAARETRPARTPPPAKPTALDELFGEAPRQELSWDKPAPRRMIDDVSAWDDSPTAGVHEKAEGSDFPVKRDEFLVGEEEVEAGDEGEAPTRRRRRRRRGSSRRDIEGAPTAGPRSDVPSTTRPGRAPRADEPLDEVDDWADAELVEPVESGDDWSEPETFESQAREVDPNALPERRSSRRRRRGGRNRGERSEEAAQEPTEARSDVRPPREPRPVREPRESRDVADQPSTSADRPPRREPRPVSEGREPREARDRRESRDVREPREAREPREVREPRDARGTREVREPREPRQRPPRPVAEATRRELSVVGEEDLDDEVDSSLAAELEEDVGGGPNRHPKIPTWADSLESIISANMDNHKRNEGHRGGPPRGRPRSGGGPSSSGPSSGGGPSSSNGPNSGGGSRR